MNTISQGPTGSIVAEPATTPVQGTGFVNGLLCADTFVDMPGPNPRYLMYGREKAGLIDIPEGANAQIIGDEDVTFERLDGRGYSMGDGGGDRSLSSLVWNVPISFQRYYEPFIRMFTYSSRLGASEEGKAYENLSKGAVLRRCRGVIVQRVAYGDPEYGTVWVLIDENFGKNPALTRYYLKSPFDDFSGLEQIES